VGWGFAEGKRVGSGEKRPHQGRTRRRTTPKLYHEKWPKGEMAIGIRKKKKKGRRRSRKNGHRKDWSGYRSLGGSGKWGARETKDGNSTEQKKKNPRGIFGFEQKLLRRMFGKENVETGSSQGCKVSGGKDTGRGGRQFTNIREKIRGLSGEQQKKGNKGVDEETTGAEKWGMAPGLGGPRPRTKGEKLSWNSGENVTMGSEKGVKRSRRKDEANFGEGITCPEKIMSMDYRRTTTLLGEEGKTGITVPGRGAKHINGGKS